jgi:hypothetical protein
MIPERPFLWMTERQRQELTQASRIVADFAAAVAGSRRARRGRRLRSHTLPLARVVRR